MTGPTGHQVFVIDMNRNPQSQEETYEEPRLQCWRDPKLVEQLTRLRLKIVKSKLKRARECLAETMKEVAATSSRSEARSAWEEVRLTKNEVWARECPVHQRKMEHLMQGPPKQRARKPL